MTSQTAKGRNRQTTIALTIDAATSIVRQALEQAGISAVNARSVAANLVDAECIGQTGHGLRRVSSYAAQAASGKVDGHAQPAVDSLRPGALAIDAAGGFAAPALGLAIECLPEPTRRCGIALASIRRSHHAGALGLVVESLAMAGLVAIAFANSPVAMAPWGGRRPLLGSNPIAFAAPAKDASPLVIDLSLSKVARGKILESKQRGQPIPEGWALDASGQPTTDAEAALDGSMLPMGDAKGVALAIMVEALAAGLTGANYAWQASSFFSPDGPPPHVGQMIIAIDPTAGGIDGAAHLAELVTKIDSEDDARLPGQRRQALRARAQSEGLEVPTELVAELRALGKGEARSLAQ